MLKGLLCPLFGIQKLKKSPNQASKKTLQDYEHNKNAGWH